MKRHILMTLKVKFLLMNMLIKRIKNEYKNVKRKKLYNLGKAYISAAGKNVSERKLKEIDCTYCKMLIFPRDSYIVHTNFWSLGS